MALLIPRGTTARIKLQLREAWMTRREKFRAYMSRVAAASSPALAIEQQFYVHPPGAISDSISKRFELNPSSRHLVVGGIGSGKTTQLLITRDLLAAQEDLWAVYLDVSQKQELTKVRPGCLVALAGMTLQTRLGITGHTQEWRWFKLWAQGYWRDPHDPGFEGDPVDEFIPGVVSPPKPQWADIPDSHVKTLREGHSKFSESQRTLVLLLDSLDRIADREAFTRMVEQDVAALKSAGIGVVLVGPPRSLEGFGRLDADLFDYLHNQSLVDVEQDGEGTQFLLKVLQRRATPEMLSDEAALLLARFSGGVLRDLMSLAKAAGDEAYLRGAESIDPTHVVVAADSFGRSLMIGLKPEEIETLKHLRTTGGFVRTSEDDLALMLTRRILEYRSPMARYKVHPTIASLLDQIAGHR